MLLLILKQHHQEIVPRILKRIEEAGLTLNGEKCIFAKQEIPFWGHLILKDGVKPDHAKVEELNILDHQRTKRMSCHFYA